MCRERRGFTLIEVVVALAITTVVLTTVVLVARQFLYHMLWSGETFAGVHEAALLESSLRRDLLRAGVAGKGLAVEAGAGDLRVTFPAGSTPKVVEYKLDAAAHALVRTQDGGAPQALAAGLVRAFAVSLCFVVVRGGAQAIVPALAGGDRLQRAGVLVELTVRGQAVAGNDQAVAGIALSTHVFPHFANLALGTIWRPAGGKK